MIKVMAPDGPFSIIINFKGYDIVLFSLPNSDGDMDCDLKIFKNEIDVTNDVIKNPEPNSNTLNEIFKVLDERTEK